MSNMKRWVSALVALCVVGAGVYVGGYYYVTAEWPWQHDQSAADLILEGSPAPTPAPAPKHTLSLPTTAGSFSILQSVPQIAQAVVPSPTAVPVTAKDVAQHGTLQQGTIHSSFMHGDMPVLVYLPPGYDDHANALNRYPVAYLLHGAPGNYTDWNAVGGASAIADALITTGRTPPMILAMPEGQTNFQHDSEWANGTTSQLQAESYLVGEVVPFIDSHYRTLADAAHRAIGGLSTGGYGGVNTALHHPEIFGTAFGLSGNYVAVQTLLHQTLFGDSASIAYNSPISYLAKMANPQQLHIYLAVGKSDKLDNTLQETQRMEQALVARQVPHLVEYDDGAHSWHFWSVHLGRALQYFASTLQK